MVIVGPYVNLHSAIVANVSNTHYVRIDAKYYLYSVGYEYVLGRPKLLIFIMKYPKHIPSDNRWPCQFFANFVYHVVHFCFQRSSSTLYSLQKLRPISLAYL